MDLSFLQELRSNGIASVSLGDLPELKILQKNLLELAHKFSNQPVSHLEKLHESLPLTALNPLRLEAIQQIQSDQAFRAALLKKIEPFIVSCLGPDLAAQRNINLVISVPGDQTSQIPLHTDTWNGHSPFELNLWIPLTQVFSTQSMFILPLPLWKNHRAEWDGKSGDLQSLIRRWQKDLRFIQLKSGEALLFWHALPHGNLVNQESITRWSLNMRFKSLFSPYQEKLLGDYFVPWKYGVVTEMALSDGNIWG